MRPGSITTTQARRIRTLAADGVPYTLIGAEIGCAPSTAQRHDTGPRRGWMKPDLARGRRMLLAAECVPPGERGALVERFGFASLNSFNTMLCRYRKRLSALDTTPNAVSVTLSKHRGRKGAGRRGVTRPSDLTLAPSPDGSRPAGPDPIHSPQSDDGGGR